jgi:excisionase family DNA binding protein
MELALLPTRSFQAGLKRIIKSRTGVDRIRKAHGWLTDTLPGDVPDLLTVKDAAKEFSISRATLFRWLRDGHLTKHKRMGLHATLVDRRELARLLKPKPIKR